LLEVKIGNLATSETSSGSLRRQAAAEVRGFTREELQALNLAEDTLDV